MDQQDKDRRFEKLEHRQELLENKVESDMKVLQAEREKAKAESDSALERLRVTMAEYNAKMEERSKEVIKFTATTTGLIIAVLGVLIAAFAIFK